MRGPRAPGRALAPACLRRYRTCCRYLEPVLWTLWLGGRGLRTLYFHPGRWFEAWLRPSTGSTIVGSCSWPGDPAAGTLLVELRCQVTVSSCPYQTTTGVPAPPSDPIAPIPPRVGPSGADNVPARRVSLSHSGSLMSPPTPN